MTSLLIKNATVVTVDRERRVLRDGAVAVEGDRIVAVGPTAEVAARQAAERTIDARGKIVFPGLVNTHNHLFQTMLKGLGDDRVLSDWFANMTAPSAVSLDEETVYHAAMIGCLDGLRSGTTTMLDYFYPHPRAGLDDQIIAAFRESGIRGIFGRGMMDTGKEFGVPEGIMQDTATILADCRRIFETYDGSAGGRIKVWFAPAALWSGSRELYTGISRLAKEFATGVTIHVSETPFDRDSAFKLHGQTEMDFLESVGLMGPKLLMVHCVYLTPREIRMARHYDVKISHNPVSNLYLSSGVAPVTEAMAAGVTVGLATDGAASNNTNDMIEVLKFTALMHKGHYLDPTIITAEKVLEMATIDGARAVGLEDQIGSLEPGKKADLFIFNPRRSPKSMPHHHPVSTLVYSAGQEGVETVLVDGRVVLENGRFTELDEDGILARGQELADRLVERAGTGALRERPWRSLSY